MGWIQQTKQASRKSGGPQYYLQGLEDTFKEFLKARGACEVWLGTPYGVIQSGLKAISADKVWSQGRLRPGKVGHERIQGERSAGRQIMYWFGIRAKGEPIKIEFEEQTYGSALILIPRSIQFPGGRSRRLAVDPQPLTFTANHRSALLQEQVAFLREKPPLFRWVRDQIGRVVENHVSRPCPHVKEEDLLRTSGALSHLGIHLSAYCGKGYDCLNSVFEFEPYPRYTCAIEIKKRSSGFDYQMKQILKRVNPARATILCMQHDPNYTPPRVVDIIELRSLHAFLSETA